MELTEASSLLEIIEEQQKLLKEQQQTINSLCSQLHELKKQQPQEPQEQLQTQPEPQLTKELLKLELEYKKEIRKLERELAACEKVNQELATELAACETHNQTLEEQLRTFLEELTEFETMSLQLKNQRNQNKELNEQILWLQEQLQTQPEPQYNPTELSNLEKQLEELEKNNHKLQTDLTACEKVNQELATELAACEKRNQELRKQLEELQADLSSLETASNKL